MSQRQGEGGGRGGGQGGCEWRSEAFVKIQKIKKKIFLGGGGLGGGSGGTESIRTQVNSYLSQFVLILVNSYSVFGQFVLIL